MEPVWTLKNGRTVRLSVRPDTNDWNVCQSILHHDEYRIPTNLSGVAVDVGAHIGAATVALLELNPDLRVVSIEPVPENVALLRENTAPYGDRVTVIEGAAGKGPQKVAYQWEGGEVERVHRFIANQHFPTDTPHTLITVPGVTLGQLVKQHGPIAFLKIDCEGCEDAFLDDPAIEQVALVHGEYHNGPAVELRFDKPKREPKPRRVSPEKRESRRKRAEK